MFANRLEYKYHRLVVSGFGDKNGEQLPAADSCALSDSESDFDGESDEVIFQKKKSRLFGKVPHFLKVLERISQYFFML